MQGAERPHLSRAPRILFPHPARRARLQRPGAKDARHTHELARNIWLALMGVLIVLFYLHWPAAGG